MCQEIHVSQFCHCIKYEAIHDGNEGGRKDRGQTTRGLWITCGGSLYLIALAHLFALPHTRVDFLSSSMICSFKKSSPLTIWRDEISYSHAIPWTQDKRSGNLLYPSRSPACSSHFLALFTFISEARSQLVCGPSFSIKPTSFLISRAYFTNFISRPFPR